MLKVSESCMKVMPYTKEQPVKKLIWNHSLKVCIFSIIAPEIRKAGQKDW
jgi:hypothetical protein